MMFWFFTFGWTLLAAVLISRGMLSRLNVPKSLLAVYLVLYGSAGIVMNNVGMMLHIARFASQWQIVSCYIFYMIPVSLLLRQMSVWEQYANGLFAMGLLELSGYTLGTSIAYPGNYVDLLFGSRNLSLVMTLFFSAYFPAGNIAAAYTHRRIFH